MRTTTLHVVREEPSEAPAPASPAPATGRGDRGDVALMAMIFGVNLVPLVGEAVSRFRWGPGTLGLAAAGALLSGRELVRGARDVLHRRR